MESKGLNDFKETLRQGMIQNFENCGYLTPILFFYIEGRPLISVIPPEVLSTREGKTELATIIRNFCQKNPVLAAGIIIEADAAKIYPDDKEGIKALNSEIKVRDLEQKVDIIVMIFSTPEGDEMISYEVDYNTKKVGEPFGEGKAERLGGIFANFFTWNKN
jgi:hypothetical protein